MSITDELRHEVAGYPFRDNRDFALFEAIADRIDAEHEKCINAMWEDAKSHLSDESLTEHGWVRLPKDADGEYIHVGDVMEERSGHTFEVASLMAFGGSDNWLVLSDARNFSSFREPHDLRHYHAPTVEDVLQEFVSEFNRDDTELCDEEIIERFAAKLRLAGDDE